MSEEGVHYVNAWASFTDSNTIMFRYKGLFEDTNVEYSLKAKNFVMVILRILNPKIYPWSEKFLL